MAKHNDLGEYGEQLARRHLKELGYTILESNWRHGKAEIDIIAQIETELVIVEVKTRSNLLYGNPEHFVSKKKISLLVEAANAYILAKDLDLDTRFDIISIHKKGRNYDIHHIKEAFLFF